MKSILEVSPTTRTTYTMDDYIYSLVTRIFDNYSLLYHHNPTMPTVLSYLPKELTDTITVTAQPADSTLAGQHHTLKDYLE